MVVIEFFGFVGFGQILIELKQYLSSTIAALFSNI